MGKYILRLDDAAERMDIVKWNRMEVLLDKYNIKPLVGVIPKCQDAMMDEYPIDSSFWNKVNKWKNKGWIIALHGYNHVYSTNEGGINPVNKRSEFAGISLEQQKEKIRSGVKIFRENGHDPQVFFAPSHTFDENTIKALKEESNIRFISDTIANRTYQKHGMTFVPQQSGRVRKLPFHLITFCYHPNAMKEQDFFVLERFIKQNNNNFIKFPIKQSERKMSVYDRFLEKIYFARRN